MEITQSLLHELFDYIDGNLIWKVDKSRQVKVGDIAGHLDTFGYICVGIDNKLYKAHRLIYLYHNGYLPPCLDHIDGNKSNNKIDNLRSASTSQNQMNIRLSTKNTSGTKGVTWNKKSKKWLVRVRAESKEHCFGYFDDKELAKSVAIDATNKIHKEFSSYKGVLNGTA